MAQNTHKKFTGTAILIAIGIIILVTIFVLFFFGWSGFIKTILTIVQILLFFAALFLLGYLFYYLFLKKQKFDVNYVNKQKLTDAATRIKRPLLKNLYISGDKGHSRALVGSISGYARIQVLTRNYLYEEKTDEKGISLKSLVVETNEKGERIPVYQLEKKEQDIFVIKEKGIAGLFKDPMVIRIDPEDHDDLVGDVTIYGYSLIPIGEYWFLNSDHLDVRKIDYAILKEAERTVAFTTLSDMKELIDRATGIDARHKKGLESKSLVELPETQNVGQQSPYA